MHNFFSSLVRPMMCLFQRTCVWCASSVRKTKKFSLCHFHERIKRKKKLEKSFCFKIAITYTLYSSRYLRHQEPSKRRQDLRIVFQIIQEISLSHLLVVVVVSVLCCAALKTTILLCNALASH